MQKNRIMKRGGLRLIAVLLTLVMLIGAIPAAAKASKASSRTEVGSKKKVYAEMRKASPEVIVFKTDKEVSYTFSKKYNETSANKKLVIDAPNATIVNKAKFQSVTIYNVRSYAEAGDDNTLYVKAPEAKIVVAKNANVKKIAIDTKSANIELRDNSNVGKLVFREKNTKAVVNVGENAEADIALSKKTDITVIGSKNSDIDINAKAANSKIKTEVPVDIDANADVRITLEKGSEGTVIGTSTDGTASVKIVNKSTETPTIKKGEDVVSTPVPTNEVKPTPTSSPATSGEATSGEPTTNPGYTWIFDGTGSGSGNGSGSNGNGSGSNSNTGSSSAGANYTISTITAAPTAAPVLAPNAKGTWQVYQKKDQMAEFSIWEYNDKGVCIKDGDFYSGYDMGYCDYYFYDAEGKLTKELCSDGSYVEYEYGDGTAFIVKRTYREIDDVAYRIETDTAVDGNLKTTVADGKNNVVCYYIQKGAEDGSAEEFYEDTKGKQLLVFKTVANGNRIQTVLTADVEEMTGRYSNITEYTYDEKTGKTASEKYTSYYMGSASYGYIREYEYYEDGKEKKRTNKELNGRISSSTSYEYSEGDYVSKRTERGKNDVLEYYETYSQEKSDGKIIETSQKYNSNEEMEMYYISEYTATHFTITYYSPDDSKLATMVLESSDEGRTGKIIYMDGNDKVLYTETSTEDEQGRVIKLVETEGEDKVIRSFNCEYNDAAHSFKAVYFEDEKTSSLEAAYDLAADIMTVTYKDGDDAAKNIVKEFSKYGMQMRITTNGDVSFDRDKNNKNQIVKETSFQTRWDDEKDEYVYYDLVKTYTYDKTTGKLKNETDTAEGKVIKTVDYEYDVDGYQVKKSITYKNDEYHEESVYTYYPIVDVGGEFVLKSSYYKYRSGRSDMTEYDTDGNIILYVSYDSERNISSKYTCAYNGNVQTYYNYDNSGDNILSIEEYTYADKHAYDDDYVIKYVEMDPGRQPIWTVEYELDNDGRIIKETEIGQDGNPEKISTYEYDEYGERLGSIVERDGKTYEYKYFEGIEEEVLIRVTSTDAEGNPVVIEENEYNDYEGGVFTKLHKAGDTLSLEISVAKNTTDYSYPKYDISYSFEGDVAASASAIKFEIKKDDQGRITNIDSTRDNAVVEFLNIRYEYTGDVNTKTVIKKEGEETVYNFDENGNEIE